MNLNNTILITGVGGAAGVFLIKHLQKNNFRVVAVDSNPNSYGLLHGNVNIVVPDCLNENYTLTIQNICFQENISFILPLIDEELAYLKSLESDTLKVVCPQINFINLCLDKFVLMRELSKSGIYTPETFLLSENFCSLQFPLIVKPRTGRGSRDVYIIHDLNELNEIKCSQKDRLDKFLVQEKIEGDEYTVSSVTNQKNQFIAAVPKRVIEKRGITKIAITENHYEITKMCETIIKKLKPGNPFNVQLIINKTDKKPYVFEINPRYSTTTTLTINAGVDEIMVPLSFYTKSNIKVTTDFIEGMVLIRSIREEFLNFKSYNKKFSSIHKP